MALSKEEKRLKRNEKLKQQYQDARAKGYTPQEARKLSQVGKKKFTYYQENFIVGDKDHRRKRWSKMSSNKYDESTDTYTNNFDDPIRELAEELNRKEAKRLDIKYNPDASYGYAVVYHYYTQDGDLEFWEKNTQGEAKNYMMYEYSAKARQRLNDYKRKERLMGG